MREAILNQIRANREQDPIMSEDLSQHSDETILRLLGSFMNRTVPAIGYALEDGDKEAAREIAMLGATWLVSLAESLPEQE